MSALPNEPEPPMFERQYPRDRYVPSSLSLVPVLKGLRFGEEAADNARIWKMYRDNATETGQTTLDGWNRSLDILLIFVSCRGWPEGLLR